jgi:hypothetical protein
MISYDFFVFSGVVGTNFLVLFLFLRGLNLYLRHMSDKAFPATGLERPLGFQEVEAPEFLDNRHIKVVRLSALPTGRRYHQEGFLVLISVRLS